MVGGERNAKRGLYVGALVAVATLLLGGCASCADDAAEGAPEDCPAGMTQNPITSECEPREGDAPPLDAGHADGPGDGGVPADADAATGADADDRSDGGRPMWEGPWMPEDPDDVEFFSCEPGDYAEIEPPTFVVDFDQNYMFGVPYEAEITDVSRTDGQPLSAFVFGDPDTRYVGFVLATAQPPGQTNVSGLADHVLDAVRTGAGFGGASVRSPGYQTTTHDRLQAIVERQVELGAGVDLHDARDAILAALAGVGPGVLDHGSGATVQGDASETVFGFEVVRRGPEQFIVAGAFARASDLSDLRHPVAHRVADVTGGTALAWADATLAQDCISYMVRDTPEVDIIISLDASGSMDAVRDQLSGFAQEFTQLLDDEDVDWRVGVTGVDCESIQSDPGVSEEFRLLWPPEGYGGQTIMGFRIPGACEPLSTSLPGGGTTDNNGKLIGGDFTRDPAVLADRMQRVSRAGNEYTFTMGLAALDRTLPRAEAPGSIRPNAAVVLVLVTDEIEQLFEYTIPFLAQSPETLTAAQRTELEEGMQPWLDFATKPELGTTIFGLYWPPQEDCPGNHDAAQIGHDSDHAVTYTSGTGGNVCNADVTGTFRDVADAVGGLASGLRLHGVPFAPTLAVEVERGGAIEEVERRREDGFDYDHDRNRIVFHEGPTTPRTNERITIPYLRWDESTPPCETAADCPDSYKACHIGQCR